MSKYKKFFSFCLGISFFFNVLYAQFYDGYNQNFGKNRVRYRQDWTWKYYRFDKFDIYSYEGGDALLEYVGKITETELENMESLLGVSLRERVEFLLFQNYTDFKQSNIGLNKSEQIIGGLHKTIGKKAFLFLSDNYLFLRDQIRERCAEMLVRQMMYGGFWQETWRGSFENEMPNWFFRGLLLYIQKGWTPELEDYAKAHVFQADRTQITENPYLYKQKRRYKNLDQVPEYEDKLMGAVIWHFLFQKYGKTIFANTLYSIKSFNSTQEGVAHATGYKPKELYKEAILYFSEIYANEFQELTKINEELKNPPQEQFLKLKPKPYRQAVGAGKEAAHFSQFSLNIQGDQAVFVENIRGRYKLYLVDAETKKKKKIFKKEAMTLRQPDYSFPIVKWHPDGTEILLATQRKGATRLYFYDTKKKKWRMRLQEDISQILDFNYDQKGEKIVFSAVKNGNIQLFLYDQQGDGFEQITQDNFDHLQPSFTPEGQILFTANFPKNQNLTTNNLQKAKKWEHAENYSIYLLNRQKNSSGNTVTTIEPAFIEEKNTNTLLKNVNYRYPFMTEKGLLFLSDENGIYNRYILEKDSVIRAVDTAIHYQYVYQKKQISQEFRNIQSLQVSGNSVSELIYYQNKPIFRIKNLDDITQKTFQNPEPSLNTMADTSSLQSWYARKNTKIGDSVEQNFKVEYLSSPNLYYNKNKIVFAQKKSKEEEYLLKNQKNKNWILPEGNIYNVNFTLKDLNFEVQNTTLQQNYQLFQSNSQLYNNNNVGGFFMLEMFDLMEDHYIDIGLMIQADLIQHEAFISYKNLHQRLGKEYILYKRTKFSSFSEDNIFRYNTYLGKFRLIYPFTEFLAFSSSIAYRADCTSASNVDLASAMQKNVWNHLSILDAQLIFDNTFQKQTNIYFGTRTKVFAEYYQEIPVAKSDVFVVGFDARHYERLFRNWILAFRLAGSSSFGHRKLIYYLGGTDSDIFSSFKSDTPIDFTQNYFFQTLATPIRGFELNTKNGNNMLIFNAETRLPIISFFVNRPMRSGFLRDFQLIGFFDAGLAWSGLNPWSDENRFVDQVIQLPSVNVIVRRETQPWIFSSGLGVRINVFGYFIRWDLGWRIHDFKVVGKPRNHLSLGLDF